jgi:hypothetical protein
MFALLPAFAAPAAGLPASALSAVFPPVAATPAATALADFHLHTAVPYSTVRSMQAVAQQYTHFPNHTLLSLKVCDAHQ